MASNPFLWPLEPNWASSVQIASAFRTDIVTSRSGKEQRRALRSTPRRSVSFTSMADGNLLLVLRRSMANWQNQPVALADPVRRVAVVSAAPGNAIQVASLPEWLVADAQVLLTDGDARVLLTVMTATGTGITVTPDVPAGFGSGSLIRPALVGQLATKIETSLPTSGVATVDVKFDVTPASERLFPVSGGVDALHGREVFVLKPNWLGGITATHDWDVETVDVGFGVIETFRPIDFGSMTVKATFLADGQPEARALESFYWRCFGQQREFFMPTWINDLPLKVASAGGTSTFRVAGIDTYAAYSNDPVYQSIAVIMVDGRRLYRHVESMTTNAGDTVLTVDSPWLFDINPSDVAMICWMPVMRLASDDLTLEWLTADVAQTQLAMTTLPIAVVEAPTGVDYDGAAQWAFENWGGDTPILDLLDRLVNVQYPGIFN
ncbi:hypothetical protein U1872_06415 [Sphingomonas sp. RB3P16]|uniref:hypothetical protein n=1 Tax=Parasphingomonas frigoris TaxID=3096163 RepID=UPI002FCABC20